MSQSSLEFRRGCCLSRQRGKANQALTRSPPFYGCSSFTLFLLRSTTTTPLLFPLQTPPNSSFHFLTSFPQIPTSYCCSQTQPLRFQILFFFLPLNSFNDSNNKLFFSRRPISDWSVSEQWRAWKAQTPRGFQVLSGTGIWVIVDSGDEGRGDGRHSCFARWVLCWVHGLAFWLPFVVEVLGEAVLDWETGSNASHCHAYWVLQRKGKWKTRKWRRRRREGRVGGDCGGLLW